VEVSVCEIYCERVRDLLTPGATGAGYADLRVREHPREEPTVEGLRVCAVTSAVQLARLLADGVRCRAVAAASMCSQASRAHVVVQLRVTRFLPGGVPVVSCINLVDLAGSERVSGGRGRHGTKINRSLLTLRRIIHQLAESSGGGGGTAGGGTSAGDGGGGGGGTRKQQRRVIAASASPVAAATTTAGYRESTLTWLLKENLGGNSRTFVLAALSPSEDDYEESLRTLRFAAAARRVRARATVNADHAALEVGGCAR
jgi:hypothetical protein